MVVQLDNRQAVPGAGRLVRRMLSLLLSSSLLSRRRCRCWLAAQLVACPARRARRRRAGRPAAPGRVCRSQLEASGRELVELVEPHCLAHLRSGAHQRGARGR